MSKPAWSSTSRCSTTPAFLLRWRRTITKYERRTDETSEFSRGVAQTPEGAPRVQHFHRQLFADSAETMRMEIKRITGVDVREATAEVGTKTGTVVHGFTSGTMVQVFLLAHGVPAGTWSGSGTVNQS